MDADERRAWIEQHRREVAEAAAKRRAVRSPADETLRAREQADAQARRQTAERARKRREKREARKAKREAAVKARREAAAAAKREAAKAKREAALAAKQARRVKREQARAAAIAERKQVSPAAPSRRAALVAEVRALASARGVSPSALWVRPSGCETCREVSCSSEICGALAPADLVVAFVGHVFAEAQRRLPARRRGDALGHAAHRGESVSDNA